MKLPKSKCIVTKIITSKSCKYFVDLTNICGCINQGGPATVLNNIKMQTMLYM